jgi:hypothetical protein
MSIRKFDRFSYKYLEGARLVGPEHYPMISSTQYVPDKVVSFSERNRIKNPQEYGLDHFIYDYLQEQVWNNCDRFLDIYRKFNCVITTDFSAYRDAPLWERKYNVGRNRTIAYYLQKNGVNIIPVASWAYLDDFDWCLDGLPRNASIAISTNGCMASFISHTALIDGIARLQELLAPSHLVICGSFLSELSDKYDNVYYYQNFSQRLQRRLKNGE